MAKYEVHIPAVDEGTPNITLKVSAENWMSALKAGLQRLGEQGAVSQNVMVDIQEDNSIHVTEPINGRVFRIRELSEEEAAKAPVKKGTARSPARRGEVTTAPSAPAAASLDRTLVPGSLGDAADTNKTLLTAAPAVAPQTSPTPRPQAAPASLTGTKAPPVSDRTPAPARSAGAPGAAAKPGSTTLPPAGRGAVKSKPGNRTGPRLAMLDVEELEHPVKPVTGTIGRARVPSAVSGDARRATDEVLTDVFMRVPTIDELEAIEEAMEYVLNLAMEKVPCEAGSVLRADTATGDLRFLVAKGPKSKELMASKLVIPNGTGIAGFCVVEGVSVAVSDVQKDPRFYAGVSQKVDYSTRSLLCAPMMTHGRSFGCIQVLNRNGGPQFLEHEVGVVAYLAHQAALYLNARV